MANDVVTAPALREMKAAGRRIVALTAYDYPTARLVDAAGIDIVLVGDSVGNTMLGYEDTLPVTMEDMLHHTQAVARGVSRALIVADMPFMSYQVSIQQALQNAGRLIKEGGAHAVKLEGGAAVARTVESLVAIGIPVMGHLGMTPQSKHLLGGYRRQAKTEQGRAALVEDAKQLQQAGAFSIVLELVDPAAASAVTASLDIPTIGIGAGPDCDGQVLVVTDLLGMDERFTPRHAKQYARLHEVMSGAFSQYASDVREGRFPPAAEESREPR